MAQTESSDFSVSEPWEHSLDEIDYGRLLERPASEEQAASLTADWILQEFDLYYRESRKIPGLAKAAFEHRDPAASVALSKSRLSMYSVSITALGARLREAYPELLGCERLWRAIESRYVTRVEERYASDLAMAYIRSVRRIINRGEWAPVEYAFIASQSSSAKLAAASCRRFASAAPVQPETIAQLLRMPNFSVPFRDLDSDASRVAERINQTLSADTSDPDAIRAIEMVDAGFFRDHGAYLVGRVILRDASPLPLIIALLNDENGIFVDALLTSEADGHNLFSSTLANFHATNPHYHELAAFLHMVMPRRPLGLHYSTIGFNHVGKVAVMNELKRELASSGGVFETAVGFPGTVAMGFALPSSEYNLKVIRDTPTAQYKWGAFEGIDSVLKKYARVHEINRTGSMLDNIIYYNLKLDRAWFAAALLDELLEFAGASVSLQGSAVVLKHLIVQRRVTPLPVFLENASRREAEAAIVNLGHCIKNNAAANIFNKDLDARNYGVSRFQKVFLFDYDALEPFSEIKIHTNVDMDDGEEDVPDWFYEDGVVFLPEEVETGLRIPNRALSAVFRDVHADLLTTGYWERIQRDLRAGKVPMARVYPESRRFEPNAGIAV